MSIDVKFFASLREEIGISDTTVSHAATAEDVWAISTNNAIKPNNLLVAINLEYAQFTDKVKDGDEVAFLPPVTGG